MPNGMQTIDAGLPRFTGRESIEERVAVIQNYLFLLQEELRYVLRNLGKENLNPGSLEELETEITDAVRLRLEGESGELTELAADVSGLRAQVTDEDGNYTVLNLKSDGLHVGSASGTTTIAGSSVEAGSLRLSDNLSFSAVGSAAANADALARALAGGTPVAATVGTFINGRNIYSPNIYTNLLTLQPPQATQQWSGGLDLKGYYDGRIYDMFRLSYAEYDNPNVEVWSPDDANLWIRDFGEVYVNCPISVGSMTCGTQSPIQRGLQGKNGQIYFQIVG